MQLGISSYAFGWAAAGAEGHAPMSAFDLLDRAAEANVQVVQIADNLPLHALAAPDRNRLLDLARSGGIQLEVGTRGIAREHLLRYLEIATQLESDVIRVVIDAPGHEPDAAEVILALQPLMATFERAGVVLALENHDRFPAGTLRRVMEQVDSPSLGICLDTANSLGAQEGVAYVAEVLAPWVANLHIKDIAIRRLPHLMGFTVEGRPAGEGDLDIPALLGFIQTQVPRPVNAILELWPPPEAEFTATLEKEAAWVSTSIKYLRTLIPAPDAATS